MVLVLAGWTVGSAWADAEQASALLRRAQQAERGTGDLVRALELYRGAAEEAQRAELPVEVARAELRAASCLRRLGRVEEAAPLLDRWRDEELPLELRALLRRELAASGDVGTDDAAGGTGPGADGAVSAARLLELEQERDQLQSTLDELIRQSEAGDAERRELGEALRARMEQLKEQQRLIDELRRRQADPESPDEVLRRRQRENRERSRTWTTWARRLHQEGRFEDARAFLHEALRLDPDNTDAGVLLGRVSAPLGDRERLYQEILEVVALSREVARARRMAQIRALLEEGESLREEGRLAASTRPLLRARALLDGQPTGDDTTDGGSVAELQRRVDELLSDAERQGVELHAVAVDPPDAPDDGWRAAVRGLLAAAGQEVRAGLELGLHDLDRVLARTTEGLPPRVVRTVAGSWTVSAERPPTAELVSAYLHGAEAEALAAPGASVHTVAGTAVVVADHATQGRIADRLLALGLTAGGPLEVRIHARTGEPGEWATWLASAGIASRPAGDGARVARIPSDRLDRLRTELAARTEGVRADAVLRPPALRAFRLLAGRVAAPVTVDVLPVPTDVPGVGVRVATSWAPGGRTDGVRIGQDVVAGSPLEPGDGLLIHGLADPEDPRRDLSVLVVHGARAEEPAPAAGGDLPPPSETETDAVSRSEREHALPSALVRYHELGVPTLYVADLPLRTREEVLLDRLRAVATDAVSVRLAGASVRVIGPDEAHAAVRARLRAWEADAAPRRFEVEVFAVPYSLQAKLPTAAPKLSPVRGGAFAWCVLDSRESRQAVGRMLLSAGPGHRLLRRVVEAPATGRADVARLERNSYRRALDTSGGETPSWTRSETAWIETGLLVALRPFGLSPDGRVELELAIRATSVTDHGVGERRTPLGVVHVERPTLATIGGDVAARVPEDGELLITALRSPFEAGEDRASLVLLVRPLR